MSKNRKICLQGGEIKHLASLLSRLLSDNGWTDTEFAKRCRLQAEILHAQFPERGFQQVFDGSPDKIRNRFASIMICCLVPRRRTHAESGINWERAAKQVYEDEIEVYARTLNVHSNWLKCAGQNDAPIEWDLEGDSKQFPAEHITRLLRVYEKMAGQMYVISRFIPGELTTEEFLYSYLDASLCNSSIFKSRTALHKFALITNSRRLRLFTHPQTKNVHFTSILLLSQLENLACGKGIYELVDKELRLAQLLYLKQQIEDKTPSASLLITDDTRNFNLVSFPNDCFVSVICGDVFSLQCNDSGIKYWVGRSPKTIQNLISVKEFMSDSKVGSIRQTLKILDGLINRASV